MGLVMVIVHIGEVEPRAFIRQIGIQCMCIVIYVWYMTDPDMYNVDHVGTVAMLDLL